MHTQTKTQTEEQTTLPADPQLNLYLEREPSAEFEPGSWLPQSFIDAFAEATGWELARIGNEIKIVDMSQVWPAKTPTAHRGKCDRVAEELSKLL
ncbi:hypothetical protein [Mariniblastus fucicola]|uniref:Uncharacterized protein n=1 Tax=Mariniblastus fucicola TaxID=980251 RepID=A0A5B9PDP5_9BACT|nr:hypothetical protein [Mariniblastus fucicola]QEG23325.1 hypothetical protein MFFC18_32220 [Mariniblastus fucicola]